MTGRGGQLQALAHLYGIQTSYLGANQRWKQASPEALLATLRALGAPVERFSDVAAALRERRLDLSTRPVEPIVVAWDGCAVDVEVRLSAAVGGGSIGFQIRFEDGTSRSWSRPARSLPIVRSKVVEGVHQEARRARLPSPLPWGYHRLRVETAAWTAEALVISAPMRAYSFGRRARLWGLFVPLYALHSERSWGAGDFSDLERLVDWASAQGAGVVSTLPFLAGFLDEPCEPSPYAPATRLLWNEVYVDPSRAPEWEGCGEAKRRFESREFRTALGSLRSTSLVDYHRLMARKRETLQLLAACAYRRGERRSEMERFGASRPVVLDYARFRASMKRRRAPWPEWPSPLREGVLYPDDYDQEELRYHVYSQWLADRQIRSLAERARRAGPGLYLDLPLGTHPLGFDAWREQGIFATDISVGAPPDAVFTGGQDWNFPPILPERSREQGHRYLAACLRHQLEHAGLLRIDHVMGLHRLFWIPRGIDYKEGVYVRYPSDELYALVCLESHRFRSTIVGENLGIVPGYVHRAMARHGLRKMYLMQYALEAHRRRPLRGVPSGSVASLNSHDTPLFSAFWKDLDIRDRLDLGLLDETGARGERRARRLRKSALLAYLKRKGVELGSYRTRTASVLHACLRELASSRAGCVLVNLEDLWGETEPQNVPGSGRSRPNWQRKLRYGLEELSRWTSVLEVLKRRRSPPAPSRD